MTTRTVSFVVSCVQKKYRALKYHEFPDKINNFGRIKQGSLLFETHPIQRSDERLMDSKFGTYVSNGPYRGSLQDDEKSHDRFYKIRIGESVDQGMRGEDESVHDLPTCLIILFIIRFIRMFIIESVFISRDSGPRAKKIYSIEPQNEVQKVSFWASPPVN